MAKTGKLGYKLREQLPQGGVSILIDIDISLSLSLFLSLSLTHTHTLSFTLTPTHTHAHSMILAQPVDTTLTLENTNKIRKLTTSNIHIQSTPYNHNYVAGGELSSNNASQRGYLIKD